MIIQENGRGTIGSLCIRLSIVPRPFSVHFHSEQRYILSCALNRNCISTHRKLRSGNRVLQLKILNSWALEIIARIVCERICSRTMRLVVLGTMSWGGEVSVCVSEWVCVSGLVLAAQAHELTYEITVPLFGAIWISLPLLGASSGFVRAWKRQFGVSGFKSVRFPPRSVNFQPPTPRLLDISESDQGSSPALTDSVNQQPPGAVKFLFG